MHAVRAAIQRSQASTTALSRNQSIIYSQPMLVDLLYEANRVHHILIKPDYTWTNWQVERKNGMIKDATV